MRFDPSFLAGIGVMTALSLSPGVTSAETPVDPTYGAPRVHVETSGSGVILFRVPSREERSQLGPLYRRYGVPICRAPCDRVVDGRAGQLFLVGGEDVTPSATFELARRAGDLTLFVQPGSREKRSSGSALIGVGSGLIGGGLVLTLCFFIFGHQDDPTGRNGQPTPYRPSAGEIAGYALMGTGLASLVGGIALITSNRTTVGILSGEAVPLGRWGRLEGGALRF
jgi:hypothetical protein